LQEEIIININVKEQQNI